MKKTPAFVEPVSLITLGLITLALVVSIPYISGKNVQILRYNPDALIRQRERTGECEGWKCLTNVDPNNPQPAAPAAPQQQKTAAQKALTTCEEKCKSDNNCLDRCDKLYRPKRTTPPAPATAKPKGSIKRSLAWQIRNLIKDIDLIIKPNSVAIPNPLQDDKPTGQPAAPAKQTQQQQRMEQKEAKLEPKMPVTVTQNDYQKCLDDKNSPSECANILQHIGETIITPAGQKECQPGKTKTSGNTIKSCSKSGTWSIRTCQHGITNNQCNPPPPPPPSPSKPVLPPPTTNLKNQFETCSGNNECKSGNCAGAYLSFGEPRLLPGKACVPSLAEQDTGVIAKHQQDLTNTAIVTAIANAPLVPGLVTTAGQFVAAQGGALATTTLNSLPAWAIGAISTAAKAVAPAAAITTGLTQTALEINCQVTGDPSVCNSSQNLALMTMAGYQISLDMQGAAAPQLRKSGVDYIDEALFNERIRGYGSKKNIDTVRNYLANRPSSNYSSALYQKTEVINQPNEWSMFASADDARLAPVVDDIRASLGNPEEYAGGLEIDDITQAIYARNQPIYSQPYSYPWSKNTLPTNIIRNLGFDTTSYPNNPYWGRALLGDFFGTKPYCVGNVCYQNAILTQATAATYGKTTLVGSYNEWPIPGVPSTPGHTVNLFIEPSTGNLTVADPTWGMSFPSVEKYYEYLQSIGKSVNLYWNFERIFIPKIK